MGAPRRKAPAARREAGENRQPLQVVGTLGVEQGFRAQAARLRQLTECLAGRHALRWSMRVLRGSLAEAPRLLTGESNLLFLASAPPLVAMAREPGAA